MYEPEFFEIRETNKISENLEHKISQSFKGDRFYLEVVYLKGRFVINKTFTNTMLGKEEMESAISQLDSEKKVKEYLNI